MMKYFLFSFVQKNTLGHLVVLLTGNVMVKNKGELGKLEMPTGFYGWYAKFNVGSLRNFQLVLVYIHSTLVS